MPALHTFFTVPLEHPSRRSSVLACETACSPGCTTMNNEAVYPTLDIPRTKNLMQRAYFGTDSVFLLGSGALPASPIPADAHHDLFLIRMKKSFKEIK